MQMSTKEMILLMVNIVVSLIISMISGIYISRKLEKFIISFVGVGVVIEMKLAKDIVMGTEKIGEFLLDSIDLIISVVP